jgi:hypothetical protein
MHTFVINTGNHGEVANPIVLWDCDARRGGKKGSKYKRKAQRKARRIK